MIYHCDDLRRYTGKERDQESGLDYFGARYFGSSMGRFMSPDFSDDDDGPEAIPFYNPSNPQSMNLYSYVRNNPISNSDPDGHDCVVQTRTSSTTESVSTSSGNCDNVKIGDGQTKTYVPGTVTSITANGGNSIDIGYNSYGGESSGVTNASSAPTPDRPGLAFNYGNNAQGYHTLGVAGATMNDPRTYALWFGASALGGGALAATGIVSGGGTALGSLASAVTEHGAARLAERGITTAAATAAIAAAKQAGTFVEAMGRYGPQIRYTANGMMVVVATTGQNAGKIITAMWK
jgi:RHS repeat-associated protein